MTPWLLVVLLVGVLQSALLSHLTLFGHHPNLMLAVVVSWSLLRGGREGLIWGFIGGMVLDLLAVTPFGTFTLAMLLTSLLTGLVELSLFRPVLALPVGVMLVASPLFHLTALLTMQALGWSVVWAERWTVLIPTALLDALLILFLFPLMRRLSALAGDRAIEWS